MEQDKERTELYGRDKSLLDYLRKPYDRFLKIKGDPREIALGMALGLFVGMSPFMGIQMAVAVFLAAIFKWNKISAAIGVWISNPLTAPFIYPLTYLVGSKLFGYQKPFKLPEEFDFDYILTIIRSTPDILFILIAGGIVIGLPLAVAGYYFSYAAITEYRKKIKIKLKLGRKADKQKSASRKLRKKQRK